MPVAEPGSTELGVGQHPARNVPVVVVTGYLGAGKTTLLNHVLSAPRARIGVVINDFGDLNVDAGLVTGHVDEPVSIAGGCLCHLPDDGVLDVALARLADPRLALDAIIVEASGVADPIAVSRMIRFSGVDQIRHGGLIDVIDAVEHFATVDTTGAPLARYRVASLVVVNKLDQISAPARQSTLSRIEALVHKSNPDAYVIGTISGRIDPKLLFDVAGDDAGTGHMSFREPPLERHHCETEHPHAESVTVVADGAVDPGALVDLLEEPPPGVYRLKGTVAVGTRHYLINAVGRSAHVRTTRAGHHPSHLVAIGTALEPDAVRTRLHAALRPSAPKVSATGMRRLQRLRRLSV